MLRSIIELTADALLSDILTSVFGWFVRPVIALLKKSKIASIYNKCEYELGLPGLVINRIGAIILLIMSTSLMDIIELLLI